MAAGMQAVSCAFKIKHDDPEEGDFTGSVNSTVTRLLELVEGKPSRFDLKVEHSELRYLNNAFYVKFDPSTTNVGYALFCYLFNIQQSTRKVFMNEPMALTVLCSSL